VKGFIWIILIVSLSVSLASAVKAQTITTVAGGGPNLLPATASNIDAPQGVAVDGSGNVFIVTPNQVYKVGTTGLLTIYAGTGFATTDNNGDGGPAKQASFVFAQGAAVDANGNLFVSDDLAGVVRRIDAGTHIITTYASAPEPHGLAFDKLNNLYIADSTGVVWKVDAKTQNVTVYAGLANIFAPPSADGTRAASANLGAPAGVAFDSQGNLFISDNFNGILYRVDAKPPHLIRTVLTGITPAIGLGVATDSSGNAYVADPVGVIKRWDASSQGATTGVILAANAGLSLPVALTVANTTLYIADFHANRIPALDIRNSDPTQQPVSTFAGNGTMGFAGDGYDASHASLFGPNGVITDAYGNLYIADSNNNVVRRVSAATNIITTYAGNAFKNSLDPQNLGDGGPATSATLFDPVGLAFDILGHLYIGDALHDRVRVVDPFLRRINTVAGTGYFAQGCDDTGAASQTALAFPSGVASDRFGTLFVTDQNFADPCLRKIDAFTRSVSKYADGSSFSLPAAAARDSTGNVYVADFAVIMKIDSHQQVTVVAGDPTNPCSSAPLQDGIPATSTSLCFPAGVAVDARGSLYISDTFNNVVRQVDASTQLIFTVAGNGIAGFSGDGGKATQAQMYSPGGLFIDSSGNLYIADMGNNRVRKVVSPSHQ